MTQPKIVIIGGNYAGLFAAKNLIKAGLDIVLISPNEKLYLNSVSPRALVETDKVPRLFLEFSGIFDISKFSHIKGVAKQLVPESNKVVVELLDGGSEEVDYEYVIVATGSSHATSGFKMSKDGVSVEKDLLSLGKKIAKAKKVAVIGGGTVGVEVASEIKEAYTGTTVDLYTGVKAPLSSVVDKKGSDYAEKALKRLGVNIINNTRVSSYTETSLTVDAKNEIYDLVIPGVGVTPNSDFIPKELLDDQGYLKTDKHLVNQTYKNVFAYGEIASITDFSIFDLQFRQWKVLDKSIQKFVLGKEVELKAYSRGSLMLLVPIGKKDGVGYIFGWKIPTFMVTMLKSKDYFLGKVADAYKI